MKGKRDFYCTKCMVRFSIEVEYNCPKDTDEKEYSDQCATVAPRKRCYEWSWFYEWLWLHELNFCPRCSNKVVRLK
jgi:hypothetical protein